MSTAHWRHLPRRPGWPPNSLPGGGDVVTRKYELTDETRGGLRRVRAVCDIPRWGVRAGDVGGWVESESNLSHYGDAWVSDDAEVSGAAWVSGAVWVSGDARVSHPDHCLTIHPASSQHDTAILTPTSTGHQVVIGCWRGTTADLRALAASDEWPSGCDEATRVRYRPRLLAVADLCDAQIALWAVRP